MAEEAKKGARDLGATRGGRALRRVLVGVAVLVSLGVAGVGGWESFTAVSHYFHSWTVPAVADGVIIATTALRLAALTHRLRLPGSMLVTIAGLGGTVFLNIKAAHGNGAQEFSHALAPIAYLILLEMLGHFLKLRLRLKAQSEARITLIGWLVSPIVTTRAWLMMVRTGEEDPAAARAAIQRSIRARSQLLIICPSPWYAPMGAARGARSAALQTIRDGLLQPYEVIGLLPEGKASMAAFELLVAVNRAALVPADAVAIELVDGNEDQADAHLDEGDVESVETAQAGLVSLPAPRSEQVPALTAAPQYPEPVRALRYTQDTALPAVSGASATVTRTLGGTAGNAKARYVERADELTANGTDEKHDLLSLDSKLRITAAVAVFDQLNLAVTLPTVRKYSQAYLEQKLGRPLNDNETEPGD